jgi:hypothetical protein
MASDALFDLPKPGEDFDQFWAQYPRKVAKAEARKAWLQTARQRPPLQALLLALQAAKKTDQWRDWTKIPHASTWLRGERWEDHHQFVSERLERRAADEKREFAAGAARILSDPNVARAALARMQAVLKGPK